MKDQLVSDQIAQKSASTPYSHTQHPIASAGNGLESSTLSSANIMQLQQSIGNHAVLQLLKAKQQPRQPVQKQIIQRALVRDQEILDEKTDTFNWVGFRGERDDNDRSHIGTETGREADLTTGQKAQSTIQWAPVDPVAGEGTRMEATIGPDHNLGSSPTEANAKARVAAFKALSGKSYISGHLLNEKLGGPGDDGRNLTAISGSANTLESSNIEKYVRDPVNEDGDWYKYIVDVIYSQDEVVYNNTNKKLKAYLKLKKKPTGVVVTPINATQTKVKVWYASKLKANWYQVNTAGGRYGEEFKKNIVMNSPLSGGEAELKEKGEDGLVAKRPDKKVRGIAARTNIDAEELVLTTGNLLKSVVENREGLIERLNQVRGDKKELEELIEELEEIVKNGEAESTELKDIVYQYGYEWGYDHGYNGVYYDESGQNGCYSEGYFKGYHDGVVDAEEYNKGKEHGRFDGYHNTGDTEHTQYLNEKDNYAYDDGYEYGLEDGRYEQFYSRGKEEGYEQGFNDWDKFYSSEEDGYQDGFELGYAQGRNESPYAANIRYNFTGITMAANHTSIAQNILETFNGDTVVELTGNKKIQYFTVWYEVKIINSTNYQLWGSKGNFAWMKKQWLNKGQ